MTCMGLSSQFRAWENTSVPSMCTDGVSHGTTHSPMTLGLRCPGCGWSAGRIDVAPPLRSLRARPAGRGGVESCDIIECELQYRTREEETIDRVRVDIQHRKCELEKPVLQRRDADLLNVRRDFVSGRPATAAPYRVGHSRCPTSFADGRIPFTLWAPQHDHRSRSHPCGTRIRFVSPAQGHAFAGQPEAGDAGARRPDRYPIASLTTPCAAMSRA